MKRPDWKQENPKDQSVVILMSMEGHVQNCTDGIITPQQLERHLAPLFKQLKQLHEHYLHSEW